MEQQLDQLSRQNDVLLRENKLLTEKVAVPAANASSLGLTTGPLTGMGSTDAGAVGVAGVSGQPGGPGYGPGSGLPSTRGGGSAAGGGDPTILGRSLGVSNLNLGEVSLNPYNESLGSGGLGGRTGGGYVSSRGGGSAAGGGDPSTIGQAQEVGNQYLGKVGLNPYYDYDNGGFWVATRDGEFKIGVGGLTQLDGMAYSRPTPGIDTSSGFYNPRSRIYFEGTASEPIHWEFSFQNFFDTVQLLDAYVNFAYDPRFQVEIGRFKAPFGYEWYRIHIWDLMAPERSLWSVNYEANRRFGAMAHGVLFDQRVEYSLGSFNSQRNSFQAFNSRQDFLGFVNFKPFYPREEGFLLRNLQFGGSVDLGNENQPTVPAALRTNFSPGPAGVASPGGANAAELPFLAFNPGVLERGGRALWEAHLAYYLGGLSFVTAIEGGHEAYSKPAAASVHVPVNGWFIQTAYILTGETIRDRTLLQPLRPFDLREGRFGCGAWEVSARFSQIDLGSDVFTAGLADPHLWTKDVNMVDVGLNWYLNQFVKVYFDWEHPMFGSPVASTGGAFRSSNDLFWIRTQVYF
jgi:phosphate-selective porin OprO/OprP